jgi:flagellar biosynthesis protein FlhG
MSTQLALEKSPVSSASDVIVLDSKVPDRIIWPIAGGKGGTGKSTITANMGVALALLGYKVILVDGDLGGADLHLFFNQIAPPRSISNFLTKDVETLRDVVLSTPSANLKIVCGGNEMVGLANLPYLVKEKLLRHIQGLDADFILLDLGAGTSYNTLDLFALSDEGIIVCTPEPQARVDAYGFIKNTVYRRLRRRFAKNEAISQERSDQKRRNRTICHRFWAQERTHARAS